MNETTNDTQKITLEYNLYDLPTAQHKAGLAGLLLMLESMKMRRMSRIPEFKFDSTKAIISITRESIQTLFDDLYDAEWSEIELSTKRKSKDKQVIEPKREELRDITDQDGKKHKKTYYIYDEYKPKGDFLKSFFPTDSDLWIKLWRDMLWETLRGKPTTRGVYKERVDKNPSSVAKNTWDNMNKSSEREKKGEYMTESVVSSAFIGAQDLNAENIPFQDTVEHIFLLHFWIIASLVFIPRLIKKDKKLKEYRFEEAGYVLAIPEPSNLENFIEDAKLLLKSLETEKSGFRPRSALISIPEESGLEYIYGLVRSHVIEKEISNSIISVEVYHIEKQGNNIQVLATNHIWPDKQIISDYEILKKHCYNPLFRSMRIKNLLSKEPWFANMDSLFMQYPLEFFVHSQGKTPSHIPFFGYDVNKKYSAIKDELNFMKGGETMEEKQTENRLAHLFHQMVQQYVNRRTEEKSGLKYDVFKNTKDDKGHVIYPQKYLEDREKVCSDAFLAIRGRHDTEFIEYFTGTICSVPQFLPEEDFLIVSEALIKQPAIVKTLSMLALSASSK